MTAQEIIRRKIYLKRQHVTLIYQEIEILERELKERKGDLVPIREAKEKAQEAEAL